jgi:ketosteroid isomerase-like protein
MKTRTAEPAIRAVIEEWTNAVRKIGGQWKVTHEHLSVPYDMETGKASLDLKP